MFEKRKTGFQFSTACASAARHLPRACFRHLVQQSRVRAAVRRGRARRLRGCRGLWRSEARHLALFGLAQHVGYGQQRGGWPGGLRGARWHIRPCGTPCHTQHQNQRETAPDPVFKPKSCHRMPIIYPLAECASSRSGARPRCYGFTRAATVALALWPGLGPKPPHGPQEEFLG